MATRKSLEEVNRKKQQRRIDERHNKEAEARPDAIHRAVHFLLDQIILNNRDMRREAEFFKASLDAKLGNPDKIAEIEGTKEPDAVELAEDTDDVTEPHAPQNAGDTAKMIRQSKRFRRG